MKYIDLFFTPIHQFYLQKAKNTLSRPHFGTLLGSYFGVKPKDKTQYEKDSYSILALHVMLGHSHGVDTYDER